MEKREGLGIWSIFLAFAVGAAAGAATAYLVVPENRKKVRELAHNASLKAGRIPHALGEASSAAKKAFSESYELEAGGDVH